MSTFLNNLGFAQLAWLTIIAYILHIVEEAPRFVSWANTHLKLNYSQKKFNVENLLLFSFTLIMVVLLNLFPGNPFLQAMILSAAIGFLLNTWFHASHTLKSGVYSPGVVTACLFNPALFGIIFWKAGQNGLLTIPNLLVGLVFGIGMLPLAIIFTHRVLLKHDQ